ncbi:prepilin-type N-terminal cleavage/methylation domain-containing protein [Fimbriimonas ginsengisoli]|uniref:Prepilin-type N-terminal cleavage/methylation domain-containing protein n=1 Tax=Fimbriimonas ginsengisoli Gsoil 348 TaxID=661478 RepID=A0A068NNN2_FIMGI|nr:prepilin-type N-terminal cleavage/methylation domain-containing protein [Fimbriimonas ginsengisoli]AIE85163.1 hypothetical protein OP10G_1795 [Fimbriimonas ginsengisoli Gsoil 348]
MIRSQKGFTLIELLVVIAIIAILAAILFPVFAQAKAAAKSAASLSNVKQEGLGIIMYSGDADDKIVEATNWDTGSDPLCFSSGCFSTWAYLVNPYVKNGDILQDPLGPPTVTSYNSRVVTMTSFPGYGFNYVWLTPWNGTLQQAISMTAAAKPAETIMLANRGSRSDGDGYYWGFGFDAKTDSPLLESTVEVPDCYTIPQYCADNWGKGGFSSGVKAGNTLAGDGTGGVAHRNADTTPVVWLDGHATKSKISFLASGTNWTPTTDHGSVTTTDASKYLWDTN